MTPRRSCLPIVLALGVAATGAVGCSAIFVQGTPTHPPAGQPLTCTESRAAPWVDTYLAVALGVTTVAVLLADEGGVENLAAIAVALPAIPLGISAAWGHWNVSDCRSLHRFALAPDAATGSADAPTGESRLVSPDSNVRFQGGEVRRVCRDREDFERTRDCVLTRKPAPAAAPAPASTP